MNLFIPYIKFLQFEILKEIKGHNWVVWKGEGRHCNNHDNGTLFHCTSLKRKVVEKVVREKVGEKNANKLVDYAISFY